MLQSEVFLCRACDKGMTGGPPMGVEPCLIRRLQNGDSAALGELYKLFKDVVYRTALAITRYVDQDGRCLPLPFWDITLMQMFDLRLAS